MKLHLKCIFQQFVIPLLYVHTVIAYVIKRSDFARVFDINTGIKNSRIIISSLINFYTVLKLYVFASSMCLKNSNSFSYHLRQVVFYSHYNYVVLLELWAFSRKSLKFLKPFKKLSQISHYLQFSSHKCCRSK